MRIDHRLLLIVAIAASIVVPILLGGCGAFAGLAALSPAVTVAILAMTLLGWIARAGKLWVLSSRTGLLLRPLPALNISLTIDFGFLATPGGIGGYAANIYFLRRAGASLQAATAVAAADQILDAAFFAIALPIAALFALGSAASPTLLRLAFASGGLLLAGIAAAVVLRKPLARWLARAPREHADDAPWWRRRFNAACHLFAGAVHDTTHLLRDPRSVAIVAVLTSLQWITRYGILCAILAALGHAVPYSVTMLVQALVLHAAQWTGVPAGAGAAELGLAAALAPWVSASTFAPAVLGWRFATLHLPLLAGGLAMLMLARTRTIAYEVTPAAATAQAVP